MLIWQPVHSSQDWSNTCNLDQLSLWSGKVWTLLKPAVKCWAKPTQLTHCQVPSVVISASKLAVTSSTAPMPLNQPTKKSLCGSAKRKSSHGHRPLKTGSTNKACVCVFGLNAPYNGDFFSFALKANWKSPTLYTYITDDNFKLPHFMSRIPTQIHCLFGDHYKIIVNIKLCFPGYEIKKKQQQQQL